VRHDFVAAHADAVIRNRDRARFLVEADLDLQFMIVTVQRVIVDRFEAQFVCSIRGVRNQLAQENFLVRVQRVNHQLQQLFDFCLKSKGLFCGDGHIFSSKGQVERINAILGSA
jgi:hypothetical protein